MTSLSFFATDCREEPGCVFFIPLPSVPGLLFGTPEAVPPPSWTSPSPTASPHKAWAPAPLFPQSLLNLFLLVSVPPILGDPKLDVPVEDLTSAEQRGVNPTLTWLLRLCTVHTAWDTACQGPWPSLQNCSPASPSPACAVRAVARQSICYYWNS